MNFSGDSTEPIKAAPHPFVSEDEDVFNEKELVEEMVTGSLPKDGLAMTAYRLSKFYGNFHAVKDISFRCALLQTLQISFSPSIERV